MISYSYLDPKQNVGIPMPQKNAGLYGGEQTLHRHSKWGAADYSEERVEPDAVAYSAHFYEGAQNHIPTANRPGNNTILKNPFTIHDEKFNSLCYGIINN